MATIDVTEPWATRRIEAPTYVLSRWLFLRLLGVVYLVAFLSLVPQVTGLVGEHGLLPARPFLDRAFAIYGGATRSGALARVGTVVPPHGAVGGYEAPERGSHVASPHGPPLSLLDAAAPPLARLVRAMAARVVAPGHDARDPRDRARCSLADPRAAALAISALRRLRPSGRGPARDRADGKLRVLQPAGDRAMRAAPRRRRIAARAAARAHGGRAGAALETVRGPRSRSRAGGPGRAGLRPRDRTDAARRAPATRESVARRRSATPLGERIRSVPLRPALGPRAGRRVVGAGPGRVSDAAAVGCRLRRVPLTLLPTRLSSGPRAGLPVHARAVCF